jgi:hypothetical protein
MDCLRLRRHRAPLPRDGMPIIATNRMGNTVTARTTNNNHRGLTTAEAQARLKHFGPNAVVEQ